MFREILIWFKHREQQFDERKVLLFVKIIDIFLYIVIVSNRKLNEK